MVYDAGSLKLCGVQLIGKGAGAYEQVASLMVSGSLGVDELPFQELPHSADPSPFIAAPIQALGRRS